eukprot:6166714-Prymnesium_polylepis.1
MRRSLPAGWPGWRPSGGAAGARPWRTAGSSARPRSSSAAAAGHQLPSRDQSRCPLLLRAFRLEPAAIGFGRHALGRAQTQVDSAVVIAAQCDPSERRTGHLHRRALPRVALVATLDPHSIAAAIPHTQVTDRRTVHVVPPAEVSCAILWASEAEIEKVAVRA